MTRHYHLSDTGHWSDALLAAFLPTSDKPLPAEAPDRPKQTRQAQGWHRFRWRQIDRVGMDAEHLMRRYGIPVSGRYVPLFGAVEEVGFDVPQHQAIWAEYLLCRAGWMLTTPLLDERHRALLQRAWNEGASRPAGGGKIKRYGLVAKCYGAFDNLLGLGESHRDRLAPPQQHWRRQPSLGTPSTSSATPRSNIGAWLKSLFWR
jgi:hypothetical protein